MDAAAMGLAVQQLQLGMQAMQQNRADDARQYTEEIRRLRAEAAAAAAAAAHAQPMGARMHLPPAALYDGNKPSLDEWLPAMRQQYSWYGWINDADRIRAGSAHLAGPALEWWQHLAAAAVPTTLDLFEAGLRARFNPVTSAETARAKLIDLTQGRGTVNDYVASFRRLLIAVPSTDDATILFLFLRGLNSKTRELLRASGVATLDAAITMAVRVGTPMQHAAAAAGPPSDPMDLSAISAGHGSLTASEPPIILSEARASLAAMHHGGGRYDVSTPSRPLIERDSRFTVQRLEEYMDEHRCFGCHRVGHGLRSCPLRKVSADGSVTWSTQ